MRYLLQLKLWLFWDLMTVKTNLMFRLTWIRFPSIFKIDADVILFAEILERHGKGQRLTRPNLGACKNVPAGEEIQLFTLLLFFDGLLNFSSLSLGYIYPRWNEGKGWSGTEPTINKSLGSEIVFTSYSSSWPYSFGTDPASFSLSFHRVLFWNLSQTRSLLSAL